MVEVAIDSDLSKVKEAINRSLNEDARVLDDPVPFVGVQNFGDTSARLVIQPWSKTFDYWALKFKLPESIKCAIESVDATMPTPRREILLVGGGEG